jgi:hypothetical protein
LPGIPLRPSLPISPQGVATLWRSRNNDGKDTHHVQACRQNFAPGTGSGRSLYSQLSEYKRKKIGTTVAKGQSMNFMTKARN